MATPLTAVGLAGNGNRIWRWRKVDLLFLIGLGGIVYGFAVRDVALIVAGAGIAGIPLTQRGDRQ